MDDNGFASQTQRALSGRFFLIDWNALLQTDRLPTLLENDTAVQ
jgi:hypothetical protein